MVVRSTKAMMACLFATFVLGGKRVGRRGGGNSEKSEGKDEECFHGELDIELEETKNPELPDGCSGLRE